MDQPHNRYVTSTGMRQTKALIAGPSRRLEERLLELEKRDLKLVVGLLTGYYYLKRHLRILGTGESETCGKCEEEEKLSTVQHWLNRGLGD